MKTFLLHRQTNDELKIYTSNGIDRKDALDRFVRFMNLFRVNEHLIRKWNDDGPFDIVLFLNDGTKEFYEVLEVNTTDLGVDITVER